MVTDTTTTEPVTIDTQLDQLVEEVESMKTTTLDHLTGLKSPGAKHKGIQHQRAAISAPDAEGAPGIEALITLATETPRGQPFHSLAWLALFRLFEANSNLLQKAQRPNTHNHQQ